MTVKCLSETEKDSIVFLFQKDHPVSSIAEEFGVSHKTITRVLVERKLLIKHWRSEIVLTPNEAVLIMAIREEGHNPRDMVSLNKLRMSHMFSWFRKQSSTYQKSTIKVLMAEFKRQEAKAKEAA